MKQCSRDQQHTVRLTLNGAARSAACEPRMLLSDFLREGLGATGTHVGCEHGVCGACTVQIDGVAGRSCLTLALQVDGRRVDTVEGLCDADGPMSDLQQAFKRHHALQCGFCTAGILMSLDTYLRRHPHATRQDLTAVIGGHLCRCTGYAPIIAAACDAAARLRGEPSEETSAHA